MRGGFEDVGVVTDRSSRGGVAAMPSWPVITLERVLHSVGGAAIVSTGTVAAASGASPFNVANEMVAFPFVLHATTPIYKGWAHVGNSPGDNFSIGIYNADYDLCAQSASTAEVTSNVPQAVTLSAKLSPGLYYAALASDNNTTGRYFRWTIATTGALYWKMMGCWRQASIALGALPATATPVAYTNVAFPYFGLLTRSNFDL